MTNIDDVHSAWLPRCAALWNDLTVYEPDAFVSLMRRLASELPSDDPIGLFEVASAYDSTGRSDLAVPLYRAALAGELPPMYRRRAIIQLASSLRNTGGAAEAVDLLAPLIRSPSSEDDDCARAFLALALADLGREREALSHSLLALARHLPRYDQSVTRYAQDLIVDS